MPVALSAPVHTAEPPADETAGVTGHVIGMPKLFEFGSEPRNNTPTFALAMPVAGIAGQLAAFGVPSGTRPNVVASNGCPARVIEIVLSSGQLFARNTAKH